MTSPRHPGARAPSRTTRRHPATPALQMTRLPGGLRVVSATMPDRASMALGIWVGTGSRYESAPTNGAAHFIEHLLFKGTSRRTAREISEAVEGCGGYLNAFTSEEHTCFHARAHHRQFPILADVLSDMFLHSTFLPREIAREREVIREEIAMYYDQPSQYVHEILNAATWPQQPLGRSITGTRETLRNLNRTSLLKHLNTHYSASNTVIAAAGPVDHETVVRYLAPRFRRYRTSPPPGFSPAQPSSRPPTIALHSRTCEQTQVALGFRTCSRHDPLRYSLRLLNAVVGENMSSRLFQSLREDRGLAYSIHSSLSFWEDAGDLVIGSGLDDKDLEGALRLIRRELRALTLRPIPRSEFARARDFVLGQLELSLESTENQMMTLGEQVLAYGRPFSLVEMQAPLLQVTPASIQTAARMFFVPDRCTLAVISPRKSKAGLNGLLGG